MGTEMVFPWWFMAVTSTTLLSSLAPSPRQTYSDQRRTWADWWVPDEMIAKPIQRFGYYAGVTHFIKAVGIRLECDNLQSYILFWVQGNAPGPPLHLPGKCRKVLWWTARSLEDKTRRTDRNLWILCAVVRELKRFHLKKEKKKSQIRSFTVGKTEKRPTCATPEPTLNQFKLSLLNRKLSSCDWPESLASEHSSSSKDILSKH